MQSASSSYQDLHAYAATQANGHLDLLVINTNPAAPLSGQFNVSGFTPSGAAQFWQYGVPQDAAQSQSSSGAAALADFSGNVTPTAGGFSTSVPPYSMTVIDLAPRVPAPAILSVAAQDPAGNGTAAGSSAAGQRSLVTKFAVVFSEPVALSAGAFSLGLVNSFGSGANNGSADTNASSVLGTPVNPSGDGTTWVVPVVQSGTSITYSYSLGTAGGGGASLQEGVYRLSVTASAVTAAAGGSAMASNYTSALFHRLFGDIDGNKIVNNADYLKFKAGFGAAAGAGNYNADFDYDGNGVVNNSDYLQFKKRFGLAFSY